MTTFVQELQSLWADAKFHYDWRRYALRVWAIHRKYPDQFSAKAVDAAFDDMHDALLAVPAPTWLAWLAKEAAWLVAPLVMPFGTVL